MLHWKTGKPKRVLYIDGEMEGQDIQERVKFFWELLDYPDLDDRWLLATPDTHEDPLPCPAGPKGQAFYGEAIEAADLIVVDNLLTLFPGMVGDKENDAWTLVQKWLLGLRRQGKAILLLHHSGKNGTQLGSMRKEVVLNYIIKLDKGEAWSADQGCNFDLKFEKSRCKGGRELADCQVKLTDFGWTVTTPPSIAEIVELHMQGYKQAEIADRLGGLDRSSVSRRLKRARDCGRLTPEMDVEAAEAMKARG